MLKTVYNLKLPSKYVVHFAPIKKKFQINLSILSESARTLLHDLLNEYSHLHVWTSELSSFKLSEERSLSAKETKTLLLVSENISRENSLLKFNYEKMDIAYLFYQSLLNCSQIEYENLSREIIQKLYNEISLSKKEELIKLGQSILIDFLEYSSSEVSEELSYSVGKTKYFFSYNQNLLEHLLEVSVLSANFAYQLKLNVSQAKRAAFFHDIGKIVGQHANHVSTGVEFAKHFNLEPYILETIEFHHNYEVRWETPYLPIVRAMDKLSAGRLGARPLQLEKTKERTDKIIELLSNIEEISKVEFLAGGHIIKLYLSPQRFEWNDQEQLKEKIAKTISQSELKYQYNYQFLLKLEYESSFMLEEYSETI